MGHENLTKPYLWQAVQETIERPMHDEGLRHWDGGCLDLDLDRDYEARFIVRHQAQVDSVADLDACWPWTLLDSLGNVNICQQT